MLRKNSKSQENILFYLWKMNILYTNILKRKFMYVHISIVLYNNIYALKFQLVYKIHENVYVKNY